MSFPTVSQLSGLGESSGAVAQLGERLLCKQEVIGSIPFSSTRSIDCGSVQPSLLVKVQRRALRAANVL
jgi:hypothetical protein